MSRVVRIGIALVVLVALMGVFLVLPFGEVTPVPTPGLQVASVSGGEVEYDVRGEGEAILFIHGAAIAQTFLPLFQEPALADYRRIRIHRRGYAGSSSPEVGFTISDHAADAIALLDHLGLERAHFVGHSSGAIIAAEVAMSAPDRVQTLILLDPPLQAAASPKPRPWVRLPIGVLFRTLLKLSSSAALNAVLGQLVGDDWRERTEARVPGAYDQAVADARRTFPIEFPALGQWTIDRQRAERVAAPILYVSPAGASEAREAFARPLWPNAEYAEVPGEPNHMFPVYEPAATAALIAAFLERHAAGVQ